MLTHVEKVEPEDAAIESASYVELLDPGTLYSLNAIPFGGFARMLGEEDPTFPGSLASKSKITRIVVLAAGAGMNLLTGRGLFCPGTPFGRTGCRGARECSGERCSSRLACRGFRVAARGT